MAETGEGTPQRRVRNSHSRTEYGRALVVGLLVSLAGHVLAVAFSPDFEAPDLPRVVGSFRAVDVRPVELHIPPPPPPVSRPEVPQVQEMDIEPMDPIAPPALDANPSVGELPAPPPPARVEWNRPSYIRHQVAPVPDRTEKQTERLDRHYPARLARAGVEGVVDLWIFVNRSGNVIKHRLISSSGHAPMDTAAVRVVEDQKYLPALNRDKPVGVWVMQRVCFVQGSRDQIEQVDDCSTLVDSG